jgi:hypothetical protein
MCSALADRVAKVSNPASAPLGPDSPSGIRNRQRGILQRSLSVRLEARMSGADGGSGGGSSPSVGWQKPYSPLFSRTLTAARLGSHWATPFNKIDPADRTMLVRVVVHTYATQVVLSKPFVGLFAMILL